MITIMGKLTHTRTSTSIHTSTHTNILTSTGTVTSCIRTHIATPTLTNMAIATNTAMIGVTTSTTNCIGMALLMSIYTNPKYSLTITNIESARRLRMPSGKTSNFG
jgi:hypothetical protein